MRFPIKGHAGSAQVVVYIPFGQYLAPSAWQDNLDGLLTVPETVVF